MNCYCPSHSLASSFHPDARQRIGAALVEFAVVVPVIALFFAGMVEISRVMMLQHTADTAAYEAARSIIVPGANVAEGVSEGNALLDAAGLKATSITVSPDVITEETGSVSVSVRVPVSENSWISLAQLNALEIVSEVTLLTERAPVVRLTELPKIKMKAKKAKDNKRGKDEGKKTSSGNNSGNGSNSTGSTPARSGGGKKSSNSSTRSGATTGGSSATTFGAR